MQRRLDAMETSCEVRTLLQGVRPRTRTTWRMSWKMLPQNTRATSRPRIRLLSVVPRKKMRLKRLRPFWAACWQHNLIMPPKTPFRNSRRKKGITSTTRDLQAAPAAAFHSDCPAAIVRPRIARQRAGAGPGRGKSLLPWSK